MDSNKRNHFSHCFKYDRHFFLYQAWGTSSYSDGYDYQVYVRGLVNAGFTGLVWAPEVSSTRPQWNVLFANVVPTSFLFLILVFACLFVLA